jgi:tetratricopeptide (TPR) repeat protein
MNPAPQSADQPPLALVPYERGLALHEAGQVDDALTAFTTALQHQPGHVESIIARGHCLLDTKRIGEATGLLAPALARHPDDVRLLILKGRALLMEGRVQAAIDTIALVLAVQPGHAAAHAGLADALAVNGETARAVLHSMMAFRLAPDHGNASNFSAKLIMGGHFEEAQTVAEFALRRCPNHFGALMNRATALDGQGLLTDAVIAGEQAVAASPDNVTGRLMLAGLYLRLGRMTDRAWALYEARHGQHPRMPAWMVGPVWAGEDLTGRTILLHAEQGYGDTLHFVRYAPLVAQRGARVILAVQRPLLRLLRAVKGVDQVVPMDGGLPPADFVCPLLSLPRLFGTTLDTIPPPLAYAEKFPAAPDAHDLLRVGLVWAGNPYFPLDLQRSLPDSALATFTGIPCVQFYSLQMHHAALPPAPGMIDLMDGVQDFADTAERIAGLDLVIAVDTAVAHLAATMGKPVWLLSRFRGCWRWLHDRADSPWYPTMRIMRQTRLRDWSGVLAEVRRDLETIAESRDQA